MYKIKNLERQAAMDWILTSPKFWHWIQCQSHPRTKIHIQIENLYNMFHIIIALLHNKHRFERVVECLCPGKFDQLNI